MSRTTFSAGALAVGPEDFIAGDMLHVLAQGRDISRQLIRIWDGKFVASGLNGDVQAADMPQECKARIASFERMVGRQALERS